VDQSQPAQNQEDKNVKWYESETFEAGIAILVSGLILLLIFTFPETSKTIILWLLALCGVGVVLCGVGAGVIFLLENPPFLALTVVIIIVTLGYFFTKAVLGIFFLIIAMCFFYSRPYWVGLVLAIAGAIILLYKTCG
jgi:hypothetical protein